MGKQQQGDGVVAISSGLESYHVSGASDSQGARWERKEIIGKCVLPMLHFQTYDKGD